MRVEKIQRCKQGQTAPTRRTPPTACSAEMRDFPATTRHQGNPIIKPGRRPEANSTEKENVPGKAASPHNAANLPVESR